jgi:thiamine kinase-like enzyme
VVDRDGPRQGDAWFARENAIAGHLTRHGAPIIPLHPKIPPGPHVHLGFTMNFWEFVTITDETPLVEEIGFSLHRCHSILQKFREPLPELAILTESMSLLDQLRESRSFPDSTLALLHRHLSQSLRKLSGLPFQPLHGDAHLGNLLNTTCGLLWTDWEDAFSGPVEWDLASIIWNARILDEDHHKADGILDAYQHAGGRIDPAALKQCLIARAAVMSAWYPVLYPNPDSERVRKLRLRLDWLGSLRE